MRHAVFLDRDGTLNEDEGYFHEADKLVMYPGVPEALYSLKKMGFLLIVITNQAGIGKGLYPVTAMEMVHNALQSRLAPFQAKIDDFFYCPHTEEQNCECRKPKPGMILAARDKYNINLKESYVVGDKISDLQAGRAVGCYTVQVLTGYGMKEHELAKKLNVVDIIAKDMEFAAKAIIEDAKKRGFIEFK